MVRRIRPAMHYQHPQAPLRLLADRSRRPLARDLKAGLLQADKTLDAKKAAYLIANGRIREVGDAIDWHHYREVMKHPLARLGDVFMEGAQIGARKINGAFAAKRRTVRFRKVANGSDVEVLEKDASDYFNFDRFDPGTQATIRTYQDAFIAEMEADARATVEAVILNGLRAGDTPDDIVGDIRAVVSLTDRQAAAVMNYRNMLLTLDPQALSRQLVATVDRTALQSAIDTGTRLDQAMVDAATVRYASNYLDYRAGTIAQTEATRAANVGLQESYRQAVDRGALPDAAVRQFWQVAAEETACEHCLSIVDMNPDGVGLGQGFDSDEGPVDSPPQHPRCMCSLEVVTNLDLVPDEVMQ